MLIYFLASRISPAKIDIIEKALINAVGTDTTHIAYISQSEVLTRFNNLNFLISSCQKPIRAKREPVTGNNDLNPEKSGIAQSMMKTAKKAKIIFFHFFLPNYDM